MRAVYLIIAFVFLFTYMAYAQSKSAPSYDEYQSRLDRVTTRQGITQNGFTIIEDQQFAIKFNNLGAVDFVPAIDERYGRAVLFFVNPSGRVVYKTDQLESNYRNKGEVFQPNTGLAAVAFRDMDKDGQADIALIFSCRSRSGDYSKSYHVGEVLFQYDDGFYRDWRISDKINRFGMNVNVETVTAFVRDGQSTEFLYTARTMDELVQNGFNVIEDQSFEVDFEKFGKTKVVSGTYRIGWHTVFMIYVTGAKGRILWNFQPMGDYDNYTALYGMTFQDADGDGMKDVVVLAGYSYFEESEDALSMEDYAVYYQRAGYFEEDTEFKKTLAPTYGMTLGEIVRRARAFWGWGAE